MNSPSFFDIDLSMFKLLNQFLTKDELGKLRKIAFGMYYYGFNCDKELSIKLSHAGSVIFTLAKMEYPVRFEIPSNGDIGRNSYQYIQWVGAVKYRDGFKCVKCGSEYKTEAHHIKPVHSHPELILDVSNGMTLCKKCHKEICHD